MRLKKFIQKLSRVPLLAEILSLVGGVLYFLQSWRFAHIQTSMVDEGGYLLIGHLNVQGLQPFFQNYSFPAWYAPLSYFIPGQVEAVFGPGLRTGRYLSIFLALLTLAALWFTARRLGNRWWATAMVWVFVLSPIAIQMNSIAGPQLSVACFVAWSLFFVLGEKRQTWQVFIGALLAGLAVMTRHNIVPLVVFLVGYIFWQHGWQKGLWSLLGGFLPIGIIHAIYWPNILQLWATWLPSGLTPFLDAYRYPIAGFSYQNNYDFATLLHAFVQGFRFHFFPLVGCITVLFLWPKKGEWKSETDRRMSWFLAVTFIILNLMHMWAAFSSSLYGQGCLYCYATYIPYYSVMALILVVVSAPSWRTKFSKVGLVLRIILIILFFSGLGYAIFEEFGNWLFAIPLPAISRGINPKLWFPTVTLTQVIANKYGLDHFALRIPVALTAGLVIGILMIVISIIIYKKAKNQSLVNRNLGTILMVMLLLSGFIFSPLMGGEYREAGVCEQDSLVAYEKVGAELAAIIPEGSNVYWDVKNTVPLLYTPYYNIHPAQIYNNFSFRLGGDTADIHKKGFWNETLAKQWADEADYLVYLANNNLTYQLTVPESDSKFEVFNTSPINPCNPDTYLVIYQKSLLQ